MTRQAESLVSGASMYRAEPKWQFASAGGITGTLPAFAAALLKPTVQRSCSALDVGS